MMLTVLYFGVFLGVLVGRATCGPARKQANLFHEAEEELSQAKEQLSLKQQEEQQHEIEAKERAEARAQQGTNTTDAPELTTPKQEEEQEQAEEAQQERKREIDRLQDNQRACWKEVENYRVELVKAQRAEAHVKEGIQRSLAFVPMLCVLMIAVRMRAVQIHIRDPQPWAQFTMYVATCAVSTQVLASICWACFVRTDALSSTEVGLFGKVAAIFILAVRYIAAISLYVAMVALVVALTSMQQNAMEVSY